jgi:hypothetical protein
MFFELDIISERAKRFSWSLKFLNERLWRYLIKKIFFLATVFCLKFSHQTWVLIQIHQTHPRPESGSIHNTGADNRTLTQELASEIPALARMFW